MSESREFWLFLVPWIGGTMASWGGLSPLGIGWTVFVSFASVVIHSRLSKGQHQEHRKPNDA